MTGLRLRAVSAVIQDLQKHQYCILQFDKLGNDVSYQHKLGKYIAYQAGETSADCKSAGKTLPSCPAEHAELFVGLKSHHTSLHRIAVDLHSLQ